MSTPNKKHDPCAHQIEQLLKARYVAQHRKAKVKAYRYNSASIRVRIINPDFAGQTIPERENAVWSILDTLPEDVRSEITVLLLVTPEESKTSLMSMEFDHPTSSKL